ncbi:persulfide dioxygenase ETHE1, mitochondrial-like isoform X1 [Haliotis rubra]|uniref:persulfide dioxygenase ETHE1, mitochondrial-like isoform X1 n=2 Tax=Haliotis rubra TaxID=36100 RepID=UPI001EE58902|nr:persulfide dioxygenase ETHE1, mitochondrial-like isoform X1 [Haliotis rubra]
MNNMIKKCLGAVGKPLTLACQKYANQFSIATFFTSANRCLLCGDRLNPDRSCQDTPVNKNCRSMSAFAGKQQEFLFRQLLDYKSFTYTYLLADTTTNEAVIIDPVIEMVERDCQIVKDLGLNLVYAVNTHVHADHITGTGEIKKRLPTCKSMIAQISKAVADIKLKEGDVIKFGSHQLEVRSTPGHTDGCLTYVWQQQGLAFTGDAILVRGCGRTDFQQGDPSVLYDSVHNKIFSLPDNFRLFPAHDYTGQTMTTVAEERKYNPRLTKPKEHFIKIMEDLKLPYPKQIDRALPANMVCGVF